LGDGVSLLLDSSSRKVLLSLRRSLLRKSSRVCVLLVGGLRFCISEGVKTSEGPKAERQKNPKGISVNNISSLKYLSMYVWKSLNCGANFQLTKYCSFQQYQKGWQEIKKQFKNSLNKAKTNDVSLFYVNEKILNFSFDIVSHQSINKINKNNFQNKSKFGINKKLEKAFDFLYDYQVKKHLGNKSVYLNMGRNWALNTIGLCRIICNYRKLQIGACKKKSLDKLLNINLNDEFLPSYFYILPKLHKNPISSHPISPSYSWITIEKLKLPVTASLYTWDISNQLKFFHQISKYLYKQYKGLAMGSLVLPANLYMERILIDAFGPLDNKIFNSVLYIRLYLDDVIAILDDAYSCNFVANRIEACTIPSNFELEGTCANKINFLDLALEIGISLHEDANYNYRYMLVSLYNKPTNVYAYTDTQSFYPYNYCYSWIQGKNIRLIHNSGDLKSYNNALHEFKEVLLKILKYKDNEFINKVDFILPLNNTPERVILVKMLKQVLKIYNCNASVQPNRVLRIALPVRSGQAKIDILNKAKKK
ncbi:14922_t:CDS:2, partial [Dentiscutata heterogama]